ncbi:MAG TPA: hypothetical protein VFG87_22255 [Amycolatopsis sp.]|jgi:hypothetical protein|nr:hypothetical protein [Amycolatopsis sp.]
MSQPSGPLTVLVTGATAGIGFETAVPARPAAAVDNPSAVERLWKLSARLTGLG